MHWGLPFLTALVRIQSPLYQEAQTSLLDYKRARPCHPKSFGCLDQKPAKCQMFQPSSYLSARHRHIRGPNRDYAQPAQTRKSTGQPKEQWTQYCFRPPSFKSSLLYNKSWQIRYFQKISKYPDNNGRASNFIQRGNWF